jgi:hypothetical protein
VLQLGNTSLLTKHNNLHYRCEAGLAKVRSDTATSIASLEAKIKSVEAHVVDVAATNKKFLSNFKACQRFGGVAEVVCSQCSWYRRSMLTDA